MALLPDNDSGQVVHTCASVINQYYLVLTKGRWCSLAGKVITGFQVPCSKRGRAFVASPHRLRPQRGSVSHPLRDSSCQWILDENLWDFLINLTISPTVTESISVGCKLGFPILLFLELRSNWSQAWRKVMAACRRVHDYVTCGLTA